MPKEDATRKIWIFRIVTALVLIAVLLVSLLWAEQINRKFGLIKTVEEKYDGNTPQEALALGGDLNVHFVDVGQGDACIVELPDNRTMLIDAADTHKSNKQKLLTYIEENIKDEQNNTISYFDFAILTHPDSDHCGGMADVLDKYPAKTFYRPAVTAVKEGDFTDPAADKIYADAKAEWDGMNKKGDFEKKFAEYNTKDTAAYYNAIRAGYNPDKKGGIESVGIVTDANDDASNVITPEGLLPSHPDYYTFTFYAPVIKSFSDWNDYSPVMILDYHGKRFMLSGDAEKEEEASFVSLASSGQGKYGIFDENFTVDVFKLGHHGSRTSSSEAFIETMTTPQNRANVIAVISCGEGNKYKHPHTEVLQRLQTMGFDEKNIVRTDVNGSIAMSVRGEEADGKVEYTLYMGAETVRHTEAAVGNDTVQLTWQEIVILAIIVVLAVLLIMPLVREVRRKTRTAKGRRK